MTRTFAAILMALLAAAGCSSPPAGPAAPAALDLTPFSSLPAGDLLGKIEDWYLNARSFRIESVLQSGDPPKQLLGRLLAKGENRISLTMQRDDPDDDRITGMFVSDGRQYYVSYKRSRSQTVPGNLGTGARLALFRLGLAAGFITLTHPWSYENDDVRKVLTLHDVTAKKGEGGLDSLSYKIISDTLVGKYEVTLWYDPRTSRLHRRVTKSANDILNDYAITETYTECAVNVDIADDAFTLPDLR